MILTRKGIIPFSSLLFLFLVFPLFSRPALHARQPVTVGVLESCPPHYCLAADGTPAGFAVDMMESVRRRTGLPVLYKTFAAWQPLLAAAKSGEVQVVPAIGMDAANSGIFDFTAAYEEISFRIFLNAAAPDIGSLRELAGKKVALVCTDNICSFPENNEGIEPLTCHSPEQALLAMLSGRAEAFIFPERPALQLIRSANLEDHVKKATAPVRQSRLAIGVIKGQPELLAEIDTALRQAVKEPLYEANLRKWYGVPKPFWTLHRILTITTSLFVIAVFLLLFCRYLIIRRLNELLKKTTAECSQVHRELEKAHTELEERVRLRTIELEKIRVSMEKSQEIARFGNWDWDLPNNCLWWSDGIYRIFGLAPQAFVPTHAAFLQIVHPEDREPVEETLRQALAGEDSCCLDHRIVLGDGSVRIIHQQAEIIHDETGKAVRMVGFAQDVTEKKSTEATLKLNEERLRTLFQLSQMDGASKQELATYALESAVKMTGSKGGYLHFYNEENATIIMHLWSRDVLDACRTRENHHHPLESAGIWADCVRQRRPVIHNNDLNQPTTQGYPIGHFPVSRHMGIPVIVDNRVVVIAGVGNKETPYDESDMQQLTLLMNEAWSIIHKKEIQEEKTELTNMLRQAQKMEAIGTLAGGIAHDFNNILTPILGYAEMLEEKLPPQTPLADNTAHIIHAARRARELVQQILAFSRQNGQERKPVQIDQVVREALKLLRASIPSTISIRQHISDDCGLVLADPSQIHQIIMNLCTNAYHAMLKSDGVLSVTLENVLLPANDVAAEMNPLPGNYIRLAVSDTGIGMDEATLEKIFDPYFTTKNKGEGTGLGLSVVHGIVKSMGGRINTSSKPGRGTTFTVYLPRQSHAAVFEKKTSQPIPGGSESIMIVEDEETIAVMEQQMLTGLGYRVSIMGNGLEALHEFARRPADYDLVITDMSMPGMNGDELALKLLALRADLPIILCTGFSELIDEPRAKAIGIREFVMKPIMKRRLAEIIRKALAAGAAGHESRPAVG
jgi:PAS domain S-box-containing protein